ncbi:MAG TPA: efflux RND transporter periplasmic adaptor subunit, partial [Stellaceae bacterium]
MPARRGHPVYTVAAVAALVGAAGILFFLVKGSGVVAQPPPALVHATEVKIAPEISGRLARFSATAGQTVRKGDDLVELSNPELTASLALSEAQLGEARAARERVYAGIREEQVGAMAREIEVAKANLVYAEQEFVRKSRLAADGFASGQDLDKATAAVASARAQLVAVEKTYEAAHAGPIKEELRVADAKVENAAASLAVIATRVGKLRVRAPADGVVKLIVAEPGEAIIPGQPVMTLEVADRSWASINLREDQFGDLRVGSRVRLLPDTGGASGVEARVTELIPRGEFATWRAARVVGDHDLNTFLLRADPVGSVAA